MLDMPDGDCFVASEHGGLLEMCRDLGERVERGEVLARVHDVLRTGAAPVEYRAKRSGILAARHFPGLVQSGDTLAVVARYWTEREPVMIKLDRYDLKILRILAGDGRITKSSLAEAINLSVSPAWERVRKLEEAGLIKGYRAQIDWPVLFKQQQVLVEITLARHTAQGMRRFEQRLQQSPEVGFCYATGAGWITSR